MHLPFYPPIVFLPGPQTPPTWWVVCLEITEDGLWALSHHSELHSLLWGLGGEETPVCRQTMALIVPQRDAAIRSLLLLQSFWQLYVPMTRVSLPGSSGWVSVTVCQRFFKNTSDAAASS